LSRGDFLDISFFPSRAAYEKSDWEGAGRLQERVEEAIYAFPI